MKIKLVGSENEIIDCPDISPANKKTIKFVDAGVLEMNNETYPIIVMSYLWDVGATGKYYYAYIIRKDGKWLIADVANPLSQEYHDNFDLSELRFCCFRNEDDIFMRDYYYNDDSKSTGVGIRKIGNKYKMVPNFEFNIGESKAGSENLICIQNKNDGKFIIIDRFSGKDEFGMKFENVTPIMHGMSTSSNHKKTRYSIADNNIIDMKESKILPIKLKSHKYYKVLIGKEQGYLFISNDDYAYLYDEAFGILSGKETWYKSKHKVTIHVDTRRGYDDITIKEKMSKNEIVYNSHIIRIGTYSCLENDFINVSNKMDK